jgi:hypothetical protein
MEFRKPSQAKTWTTLGAAIGAYATGSLLDLQDRLPKPLDVPAHMGNVVGGIVIGNFVGGLVAEAYTHRRKDKEISESQVRTAATAAAFFVATAVNGIVELRTGTSVLPFDTWDFVYGAIAGTGAGAAAPTTTPANQAIGHPN